MDNFIAKLKVVLNFVVKVATWILQFLGDACYAVARRITR